MLSNLDWPPFVAVVSPLAAKPGKHQPFFSKAELDWGRQPFKIIEHAAFLGELRLSLDRVLWYRMKAPWKSGPRVRWILDHSRPDFAMIYE